MQELYLIRHINKAIDNYSDSNSLELTRWIKVSVSLLILLVLFSPITIFFEDSIILMSSAMLTVIFIYYYVFNFICFGISENANMIYQANEEEEKEEISLPAQLKDEKGKIYQRVEEALKHTGCGRRNANPALPAYAMDQEHGIRSVQPMDCPSARGRGKATDDGTPRIF